MGGGEPVIYNLGLPSCFLCKQLPFDRGTKFQSVRDSSNSNLLISSTRRELQPHLAVCSQQLSGYNNVDMRPVLEWSSSVSSDAICDAE